MQMIPAFTTAMQDRALRGQPREVYLWLNEELDVVAYRAVKHSAIQQALGIDDSRIFRALQLLIERGYLDRGERDGRLWTYRLIYSNPSATLLPAKRKQSSG